jgi:hypothetical protein
MSFDISVVLEEWKVDSTMTETKVVEELLRTPNLHAKYLQYFLYCKAKMSNADANFNRLKGVKRRYYKGEMTLQELQQRGWDQYQGLKMSMSEFNNMVEMDDDLISLQEKVDYWKSNIQILEYIMRQIQSRDFQLKAIVDYKKFIEGN